LVRRRIWKGAKNEDSEERWEDGKRGKKMPFKSPRKNTRKKRKIRRKEKNPDWNSLRSPDNQKKKSFGRCAKQNPPQKKKKKKNCFFNTKPHRRNIYMYR
jgi:hypothetical protein